MHENNKYIPRTSVINYKTSGEKTHKKSYQSTKTYE